MAKIAVLFHQFESKPKAYIIDKLAEIWRADGHEVVYLFGTRQYVPADLLIVHVDLSIVPTAYQSFAAKYPISINSQLTDIRKSRISQLLVGRADTWTGPVIVKSDLNCAGESENRLGRTWLEQHWKLAGRVRRAIERRLPRLDFNNVANYQILPSVADVPRAWFTRSDVVIEKFLPEIEGNLYHLRICQTLGDSWACSRLSSEQPIIKAHNSISVVDIAPHPAVQRWRREFQLDYGKLDYVVVDDKAVLLDVNKTPASTSGYREPEALLARRRQLAKGLYSFLS